MGCSAAKREAEGAMAARDLYDGPAFRVLRRHEALGGRSARVYVFSGKHGLIAGDQAVEPYDALLEEGEGFGRKVAGQIASLFGEERGEALAVMSDRYSSRLRGWWEASGTGMKIRAVPGSPGVRLSALRRWLDEGRPSVPEARPSSGVRFRGEPVGFGRAEAEAVVSGVASGEAFRLGAWAVEVGGRRVSPKWLLARLTGVRASDFHTHEALRVLRGLGFEVIEA